MATGGYQLTEIVSLQGHSERVWNVSWSPSGKHLASCGGDKTISFLHFHSLFQFSSWENPFSFLNSHFFFLSSRSYLGCRLKREMGMPSSAGRRLECYRVWSLSSHNNNLNVSFYSEAHQRSIRRVAWSRDGLYLACARLPSCDLFFSLCFVMEASSTNDETDSFAML